MASAMVYRTVQCQSVVPQALLAMDEDGEWTGYCLEPGYRGVWSSAQSIKTTPRSNKVPWARPWLVLFKCLDPLLHAR